MIQNLPTKSAVVEGFSLASQHADIKFLISPRLVGMTDSSFLKRTEANLKTRHSEQRRTNKSQNLPTKSAVAEEFSLASQHVDIKFLILLGLFGATDSFVFRKN